MIEDPLWNTLLCEFPSSFSGLVTSQARDTWGTTDGVSKKNKAFITLVGDVKSVLVGIGTPLPVFEIAMDLHCLNHFLNLGAFGHREKARGFR
jgi:hypothetical protein